MSNRNTVKTQRYEKLLVSKSKKEKKAKKFFRDARIIRFQVIKNMIFEQCRDREDEIMQLVIKFVNRVHAIFARKA